MAETDFSKINDPSTLINIGCRELAVKEYSVAVEALGRASELTAAEHGETSDKCAEPYFLYGKALLALWRSESDVLAGGGIVPENDKEEESDEGPEEEGEDQKESENNAEPEDANDDAVVPESKEEQPGSSNGAKDEQEEKTEEEDDNIDNLQLAWEMLDLSRQILAKREETDNEKTNTLLADVYHSLGEVALESETYEKAVSELDKSLEILKKMANGTNYRKIGELNYQLGLAHSLSNNFDKAVHYFEEAMNALEARIKFLEDASKKDSGESKEIRELLPEIKEKIKDMGEYKAEAIEKVRQALISDSNGSSSNTSKAAPSNISHLVKRKLPASDETAEESPSKKPNV